MPEAPLTIVFEMVATIISNTIGTLGKISGLFGKLLESLGVVSTYGGTIGLVVSVLVLAIVGYFLAKFFLGSGKTIIILTIVGLVLFFLAVMGIMVY